MMTKDELSNEAKQAIGSASINFGLLSNARMLTNPCCADLPH
jgi:hypothetical protein